MVFDGILILSDLDGTLLDGSASLSEGNRAAIERYIRHGGRFGFATGRTLQGVGHYADKIPLNAPGVIFNGSAAYDFASGERVFEIFLPDGAQVLARDICSRFPGSGLEIYTSSGGVAVQINQRVRHHMAHTRSNLWEGPVECAKEPWISMLFIHEPEIIADDALTYMESRYSDRFSFQLSMPHMVEIQARGADKGAGALKVCRHLGIPPENLYVAGDGLNDIQLLSCTKNAFCPKNAHPDILAMGCAKLPSNEDDCIAALIDIIEKERTALP